MSTNPADLFSLKGKTILITGATGYLGKSMTEALASVGAKVLINSRSIERANKFVNELREKGLNAESAIFDICDIEACSDYFSSNDSLELYGIINNAYAGEAGTIEQATPLQFQQSYEVTVIAAQCLLKSALPALRRGIRRHGQCSVVSISSMYGLVSPDITIYDTAEAANPPFYGAAKAALIQWSRYASCQFGKEGLRFNVICPGPFPTTTIQEQNPDFIARLTQKVPLARVGQASEIKGPVLFLMSQASSFVNGATLSVDGGWTNW